MIMSTLSGQVFSQTSLVLVIFCELITGSARCAFLLSCANLPFRDTTAEMKLLILLLLVGPLLAVENFENIEASVDKIERAAKLLIDLDEVIERALETEKPATLYFAEESLNETASATSNADREEKFSIVLQELDKIEEQIKETMSKANANRQFRLAMRLRPLVGYVGHLRRNMESLRTRVVAVATLSNLAITVNEVVDQFGDVMTSSVGLSTGIVPNPERVRRPQPPVASTSTHRPNRRTTTLAPELKAVPLAASSSSSSSSSSATPTTQSTTLASVETNEPDNFLKKIIHEEDRQ